MEDLVKFSKQLQNLISENEQLKKELRERDEMLKLAICVNGAVEFKGIDEMPKDDYDKFLKDTGVFYSTDGIKMYWRQKTGTTGMGHKIVSIDEIAEIFNTK